jgi:hypothetical protein
MRDAILCGPTRGHAVGRVDRDEQGLSLAAPTAPTLLRAPRPKYLNARNPNAKPLRTRPQVSPTYAREVYTPEFGLGLEGVLGKHHDKFCGVLNGIDHEVRGAVLRASTPATPGTLTTCVTPGTMGTPGMPGTLGTPGTPGTMGMPGTLTTHRAHRPRGAGAIPRVCACTGTHPTPKPVAGTTGEGRNGHLHGHAPHPTTRRRLLQRRHRPQQASPGRALSARVRPGARLAAASQVNILD